ncbi:MAG TPA: CBS domain-containing protein [Trueperaceae bacterium]|nr:CBS domain-containing protein [Trueperaceae bacterium]
MFVNEWMTKNPTTVSPNTPVMEAMNILREGGYRRLPIVNNDKLVGIVTDKDLKNATPSQATTLSVYELNYLLSKLTVNDVMKTEVVTISSTDTIESAALLMEEHKISGLPVVDYGEVVGMLTITDMLKAFIGVLGLREGGTRVTAILPDEPGILAKVSQAAAPSNIVAVVTAGVKEGDKRELVLRVVGEDSIDFPERLKAQGVEIADVR